MPILKNRAVLKVAWGVRITRNEAWEPRDAPISRSVPEGINAYVRKLERAWRRAAEKDRRLATRVSSRPSGGKAGSIKAENIIWIFGSGQTLGSGAIPTKGMEVYRRLEEPRRVREVLSADL